jgi:hypothetical protein
MTPNIIPGNKVMKASQKASRVPGSAHASRMSRPATANARARGIRGGRGRGESRRSARTTTAESTLIAAASRKDGVHPAAARTAANPTPEAMKPSWLNGPSAVVIQPLRSAGNHAGTRRITLMKVNASPTPKRTRAAIAIGSDHAIANNACAAAMMSEPATISRFEPYRSMSTPTGTCIAA